MSRGDRGGWAIGRSARAFALVALAAVTLSAAAFAAEVAVKGSGSGSASGSASGSVIGNAHVGVGAGYATMETALIEAYVNNPQLNSQRAATRAVDENVSIALAGYRPRVSGTSSLTEQYLDTLTKGGTDPKTATPLYVQSKGASAISNFGLTATQTLFNGFQTSNRTRQAEGQVFAARETLRNVEQSTLLNAATVYMNLLQNAALLELQRSNVNVLEVTLRQTRDRFAAGEVTRTDVAQAESSLAQGRSQLSIAESNYVTARAQYTQVVGVPAPLRISPAAPVDRLSPRTVEAAVGRARSEHPTITTAMYNVDVALQQVKIAEGALSPTLAAVGNVQKQYGSTTNNVQLEALAAGVAAQLTVPIYQGGAEYSTIRQSKETLGQRRLDLDSARDQVISGVIQAWGQLDAAKAAINSTQAQVTAAEVALNGVREEARVGQRTTLDVLNQQQTLVNARSALVTAQRDRVVASYAVLAAVGSLSPQILALKVPVYDPMVHYQQVRDVWGGVRAPDGR